MKPALLALTVALLTALVAVPAGAQTIQVSRADADAPSVSVPGGAYSEEGACGGSAPIVSGCNALPVQVPSGTSYIGVVAAECPRSPNCTGFVGTITMIVMGPSGFFRGHCDFPADGPASCQDESTEGEFYWGDELTLSGWVTGIPAACVVVCAGGPAIGDWGVYLEFS